MHVKEQQTLKDQISILQIQLEELRKLHDDLNKNYPHWTFLLLRPVITEIERSLPGWHFDNSSLQPLGVCRRVPLFFCKDLNLPHEEKYSERNSVYIVFRPGNLEAGELLYETGEKRKGLRKNALLEYHALNLVTKPLESIEEAVNFLKKQIPF